MTENILSEIRKIKSFDTAILTSVTLEKSKNAVEVSVVTDKAYTEAEEAEVRKIVRGYVPELFSSTAVITKLTPDEDMVVEKILTIIGENNKQLAAFVTAEDIEVRKENDAFSFTVSVIHTSAYTAGIADDIANGLKKCFCGEFYGRCVAAENKLDDLVIEEKPENIQYEVPLRTFEIEDFSFLEGTVTHKRDRKSTRLNSSHL